MYSCISVVYGDSSISICGGATGREPDRKYVFRMPGFSPRFFLTIAVVQIPWLLEVTEAHVTPKGARMCNWKLRITRKASPGLFLYKPRLSFSSPGLRSIS
jgi:hypothetical protein